MKCISQKRLTQSLDTNAMKVKSRADLPRRLTFISRICLKKATDVKATHLRYNQSNRSTFRFLWSNFSVTMCKYDLSLFCIRQPLADMIKRLQMSDLNPHLEKVGVG